MMQAEAKDSNKQKKNTEILMSERAAQVRRCEPQLHQFSLAIKTTSASKDPYFPSSPPTDNPAIERCQSACRSTGISVLLLSGVLELEPRKLPNFLNIKQNKPLSNLKEVQAQSTYTG